MKFDYLKYLGDKGSHKLFMPRLSAPLHLQPFVMALSQSAVNADCSTRQKSHSLGLGYHNKDENRASINNRDWLACLSCRSYQIRQIDLDPALAVALRASVTLPLIRDLGGEVAPQDISDPRVVLMRPCSRDRFFLSFLCPLR